MHDSIITQCYTLHVTLPQRGMYDRFRTKLKGFRFNNLRKSRNFTLNKSYQDKVQMFLDHKRPLIIHRASCFLFENRMQGGKNLHC